MSRQKRFRRFMSEIMDRFITEYEGLLETELQQFAEAYNAGDVGKAQSPIVQDLVRRALKEEAKMKTEEKQKAENQNEGQIVEKLKPEQPKIMEIAEKKNGTMTLQETLTLGEVLYKSRFFTDIQSASQAVAKILAGRELGLGAMVSLSKVFVVGGKIAIQAEVMADMIKRGQKYDYRIVEHTNEKCLLHFFENGKKVGESSFTIEDARRAGVANGINWQKYPRNMLFSRALSNGARWYCPDAIHGAYNYDEMGLEIDGSGAALPKPELTIETEVVSKLVSTETNRGDELEALKSKFGTEKMKDVKTKLKIKEKLINLSPEIWQKYIAELNKN